MIDVAIADPDMLAKEIGTARVEVRVQSSMVDDVRLYNALRRALAARARVLVLVGPKATYEVVEGRPLIGKDPYAEAAPALDRLAKTGAEVFINPRFSEIGARDFQPGRASHASYLVVDGRRATVCTGAMVSATFRFEKNPCATTTDAPVVAALQALHDSEFDDTRPPPVRERLQGAASKVLVVYPGGAEKVRAILAESAGNIVIRTGAIASDSALFPIVRSLGPRAVVVLPNGTQEDQAVQGLRSAGVQVRIANGRFDGTVIVAGQRAIIGSFLLTSSSETQVREVGVVMPRDAVAPLLEGNFE